MVVSFCQSTRVLQENSSSGLRFGLFVRLHSGRRKHANEEAEMFYLFHTLSRLGMVFIGTWPTPE